MRYIVRGKLHLGIGVAVSAGSRDDALLAATERFGGICTFRDVFTEREYKAYMKARKEVMEG